MLSKGQIHRYTDCWNSMANNDRYKNYHYYYANGLPYEDSRWAGYECVDLHDDCHVLANQGYCTGTDDDRAWMLEECKMACHKCPKLAGRPIWTNCWSVMMFAMSNVAVLTECMNDCLIVWSSESKIGLSSTLPVTEHLLIRNWCIITFIWISKWFRDK